MGGIYVEIPIRGSVEAIWHKTQAPALHQRWDLRFSDIAYLPRPDQTQPQRFLYTTRLGFGLTVRGEGETSGTRADARGGRASALRFWSADPKSLIREGAGYWQYCPNDDGMRFITWYDYRTRYGVAGRLFDRLAFRPLMGWATAWSFDRLRLWIERDLDPVVALQRSLIHTLARLSVGIVWLCHGSLPKLLTRHVDELALLVAGGIPAAAAPTLLTTIGWSEVVVGLLLIAGWEVKRLLLATAGLLAVATLGIALTAPTTLVAPFNPLTLNGAVAALALIGALCATDIPSARRCRRRRPEERA